MFDTIFDELEPILPEDLEDAHLIGSVDENYKTTDAEESTITTYSDKDLAIAREEGVEEGKKQGANEALAGIEQISIDTLRSIANELSVIHSGQKQANQEISESSSTLALTIVRKIFPTLREKTALNEIKSILVEVLDRLINEPKITIKVNPSLSKDLSAKLEHEFDDGNSIENLSIIADEDVNQGDCKIEWSNGSAERNLNKLTDQIDGIIAQNSTINVLSITAKQEKDETIPDNTTTNKM